MRLILLIFFITPLIVFSQCASQKREYHNLNNAFKCPLKVNVLRLDNEQIIILPDEILQFKNMKTLSLQNNKNLDLKDLFNKLSHFPNLVELDLSNCDIESLPPEISKLKQIKKLVLGANKLKHIPDEISDLKNLDELIFSQYPDDFRSFTKEEKLKLLNLLPDTKILLVDYFGGVHDNFRLGQEVVRITKSNLY